MRRFVMTSVVLGLVAIATPANAASGDLDTTFGIQGKVHTEFKPGTDEHLFGLAVQGDDAIVAVGYVQPHPGASTRSDFGLVRYLPDGSLDPTFGTDGKVRTNFDPVADSYDYAEDVAILPDGRILVTGASVGASGSGSDFALARYDPDGTMDLTFGRHGRVLTDACGDGGTDIGHALAMQADGRFVVAGHCYPMAQSGAAEIAIVRYLADGQLDPTFGDGGRVLTDLGDRNDIPNGVAIQVDGKVVVGGFSGSDIFVNRYQVDGSLDPTFGAGGVVLIDIGGYGDTLTDLAIQEDGRIVIAGDADVRGSYDFLLIRLLTDGTPDPTFGDGGQLMVDLAGGSYDTSGELALVHGGKIILGGTCNHGAYDFALIRVLPDGTLDRSFGERGKVLTRLARPLEFGGPLGIQSDGKILLGGTVLRPDADFALTRYLP